MFTHTLTALTALLAQAITLHPLAAQDPSAAAPAPSLAVDLTGDGLPDKLVFDPAGTRVQVNLGRGRWAPVEQQLPAVVASDVLISDLDGDRLIDLYIVSSADNHAWLGDGTGRLRDATEILGLADAGYGLSAQRADLDGDEIDDLLLHNASGDVFYYAAAMSSGMVFERDPDTPEIPANDSLAIGAASLVQALVGGHVDPASLPDGIEVTLSFDDAGRPELVLTHGAPSTSADEPEASSYADSGGMIVGSGLAGPGLPSLPANILALLAEMFVDDDAGEVDSADVIDGSLTGADVSTNSGDVTHSGADLRIVGRDNPFGANEPARVFISPIPQNQIVGNDAELWLSGVEDNSFGAVLRYGDAAKLFEVRGQSDYVFTEPFLSVNTVTGRTGILTTSPNASLGVKLISDSSTIIRGLDGNDQTVFRVLEDGRTGVGTALPNAALGVMEVPSTPTLFRAMDASGATVARITNTGRVVAAALEITGGGDLVEAFESAAGMLEPGTVVCVDPAHPGRVVPCSEAYDGKVLGAVSGAGGVDPGIRMIQHGVLEGDTLVAMTGRIYVRCTDEGGSIRPGDRLTTSSISGRAMRVDDPSRADGAVLGKALSALDAGTGLVLVLVNLQ